MNSPMNSPPPESATCGCFSRLVGSEHEWGVGLSEPTKCGRFDTPDDGLLFEAPFDRPHPFTSSLQSPERAASSSSTYSFFFKRDEIDPHHAMKKWRSSLTSHLVLIRTRPPRPPCRPPSLLRPCPPRRPRRPSSSRPSPPASCPSPRPSHASPLPCLRGSA